MIYWSSDKVSLFHHSGSRIFFYPFGKFRIRRFKHGEPLFKVFPLDTHKTAFFRVPERAGFLIIEHERPLVCPSRGGQGEYLTLFLVFMLPPFPEANSNNGS